MFGDLAGVQFKATLDVRGEQDATNDLILDITKNTLALGIDQLPIVGTGWELTKAYVISGALDGWADTFETGVEEATGARSDFVLRQKYDMAHLLHGAGYPASELPAELISKSTGDLKTYDELLAEAKREANDDKKWEQVLRKKLTPYERWMDSNNVLDTKIEDCFAFPNQRPSQRTATGLELSRFPYRGKQGVIASSRQVGASGATYTVTVIPQVLLHAVDEPSFIGIHLTVVMLQFVSEVLDKDILHQRLGRPR